MAENNFGYDEVVDTVTDLVKAEVKAYSVFKGKIDLAKVITWALGEYPNIKEAVEDWPVFEQQVTDLFADEGLQALEAISRNLSDAEKDQSRLYKLAVFGAVGYKNTITVIELGKQQLELGAAIFAK